MPHGRNDYDSWQIREHVEGMTQAVAGAVDPALQGRDVAVKGRAWLCNGERRVTWAEVK